MNVLLDTCALLWLANGATELSPPAREALRAAAKAYVSSVTAWEIGLKAAKGKLGLPSPLEAWFPKVLKHHALEELSLSAAAAIRATRLPGIHSDPADRLLIGVAMESQLILLSPDPFIHKYPGLQVLW